MGTRTRKALAAAALAGTGVLALQQAGLARDTTTLQAYGVSVDALGQTLAKTPLANAANPTATLASVSAGTLLNTGTLTATVTRDNGTGTETARAETQSLAMNFLGSTATADAIVAQCTASPGQGSTGTTTLANAVLKGPLGVPTTNLASNPAPNTTYGIPGVVQVIANEQVTNGDGSLTVNALHFKFIGGTGGDVIISSATCGPAVAPVPMISPAGAALTGGLAGVAFIAFIGIRRRRINHRATSTTTA